MKREEKEASCFFFRQKHKRKAGADTPQFSEQNSFLATDVSLSCAKYLKVVKPGKATDRMSTIKLALKGMEVPWSNSRRGCKTCFINLQLPVMQQFSHSPTLSDKKLQ